MSDSVMERARTAAGLSQDEMARRGATSRPTLSAYENGRKTPSLATALRLLHAADHDLQLVRRVTFAQVALSRGRTTAVPSVLPRLPAEQALAVVSLPLHLSWSGPSRTLDLTDRSSRARVYEIVLREGTQDDILAYVDGALLFDLWPELVLPRDIRAAWDPVVEARR